MNRSDLTLLSQYFHTKRFATPFATLTSFGTATLVVFMLVFCCNMQHSFADETNDGSKSKKSDLKVLFVGHDPDDPELPFKSIATDRMYELYKERTPAFESYLKKRFHNVQIVYAADYSADMSDKHDVTIFDARPKALKKAVREADNYQPSSHLPDDFSRPALTIAENSPRIGEALGLKLDWL